MFVAGAKLGTDMASYKWTGADRDGLFSNPGDWGPLGAPAGPPGPGDDATIDNGDTVKIDQPTTEVANLTVNSGTFDDNGHLLIVDDALTIGSSFGATSVLTVEGGEVDFASIVLTLNAVNLSPGSAERQNGTLRGRPCEIQDGTFSQGS